MLRPIAPKGAASKSPLSFKTSDGMITGQTIDVSESGILVRLDSPVELWLVGELSLTAGEYYIQIEARVARTFGDGCGPLISY